MAVNVKSYQTFGEIKGRLDEIADKVADESMNLDDALDLYEEAVKLAMRATELVEVDDGSEELPDAGEIAQGTPGAGEDGAEGSQGDAGDASRGEGAVDNQHEEAPARE